jgi:hypothetical protein
MDSGILHKFVRRWLVGLAVATAFGCAAAQTRSDGKQFSTLAELLALAADPTTQFDTIQVSRFLGTLSSADRRGANHQLILLPHEELIVGALLDVLRTRDDSAAELIAPRLAGWKDATQARAVHIAAVARGPYLTIPRTLLRNAVNGTKVSGSALRSADPLGSACLVLASTGNVSDLQMIQNAARLQPKSWGVWMALAYGGAMNASLVPLAEGVYQDVSAALPLRIAAATALEPFDTKAADYAVNQLQSFLAEFSGQDALVAARDAFRASVPGTGVPGLSAAQHADFKKNLYMLSALLVLKSESIHQLTLQSLGVKNQVIRMLCGIVAARRWPNDLLKAGRGLFTDYEYAKLAAVVAIYRPEQASAAAAVIPGDKFAAAKSRIVEAGLGTVLLEAELLSYF